MVWSLSWLASSTVSQTSTPERISNAPTRLADRFDIQTFRRGWTWCVIHLQDNVTARSNRLLLLQSSSSKQVPTRAKSRSLQRSSIITGCAYIYGSSSDLANPSSPGNNRRPNNLSPPPILPLQTPNSHPHRRLETAPGRLIRHRQKIPREGGYSREVG